MNVNNPAIKRILGEMKELNNSPPEEFSAAPLEENLFEWHFSVRGPRATAFEGGVYHGKILLPAEYPFKPPSITLLTPNGRFEVGKKICLSVSAHHPEHWQPAWGIRTIITAMIAFMPSKADGALAGLDYTDEERRALALRSHSWRCASCGAKMCEALPEPAAQEACAPAPAPSPSVPSELRFGYEPASAGSTAPRSSTSAGASSAPAPGGAEGGQAHGGVKEEAATAAAATASSSTMTAQPVPQATPAPATPAAVAPSQLQQREAPPEQQRRRRQQQQEQPMAMLVLALVVTIVALLVRKLLRT